MNRDLEKICNISPSLTFPQRWNSIITQKVKQGGEPMTILIGALCEEGNTIILLADKMTVLQPQALVFGHDTKGIKLTSSSMVLTAGIASNYIFIEDAKSSLNDQMNTKQIAETMGNHYRFFKLNKMAIDILSIHGFSTFDEFHQKQKYLSEALIASLAEQMRLYSLNVELLIGGMNDRGHIYHIMLRGECLNYDSPGFCCAGFGANRASPIFEFFNYSIDLSVSSILSIAFVAKKRTEILGGIGRETDIWIIDEKGITKVNDETVQKLEENYHKAETDISNILDKIEIKKEEIKTTNKL